MLESQAHHMDRLGKAANHQIQFALAQAGQQLRIGACFDAQAGVRAGLRRCILAQQQLRHQPGGHRREHAHRDDSAALAPRLRHAGDSLAQRTHTGAGVAHEGLAFARRHRAPAATVEQPHPQQVFQFLQRFGDCGLGNGQYVGRLLQTAVLRHRQKALQMPEFDAFINHAVI
jgi:hypothetical protein